MARRPRLCLDGVDLALGKLDPQGQDALSRHADHVARLIIRLILPDKEAAGVRGQARRGDRSSKAAIDLLAACPTGPHQGSEAETEASDPRLVVRRETKQRACAMSLQLVHEVGATGRRLNFFGKVLSSSSRKRSSQGKYLRQFLARCTLSDRYERKEVRWSMSHRGRVG